jgi:hypothetical protein
MLRPTAASRAGDETMVPVSTEQVIFTCSACGVERIGPGIGDVPGARTPCSNDRCGSVAVVAALTTTDGLEVRELLAGRSKDPDLGSRKGRKLEFKAGTEFFRQGQRWRQVNRTLDFINDRYDETITDEATGEVIRECHEQLSEHQGRGSARRSRLES